MRQKEPPTYACKGSTKTKFFLATEITLWRKQIVTCLRGSEHELRGDRSGLRTDRDDVLEGRSRGGGLRALLPHERGVRSSGARRTMEGCHAGEAARLGANLWRLPGHRGLASMYILQRADGEVSRR